MNGEKRAEQLRVVERKHDSQLLAKEISLTRGKVAFGPGVLVYIIMFEDNCHKLPSSAFMRGLWCRSTQTSNNIQSKLIIYSLIS